MNSAIMILAVMFAFHLGRQVSRALDSDKEELEKDE